MLWFVFAETWQIDCKISMVIQWDKNSWNTLEDEGQGELTFHDRYKDTKLIVTMPMYCWHSDGKQTIGINWQKPNIQNFNHRYTAKQ